jgi:hypothetical protein
LYFLPKNYYDNQVEEDEVSNVCSTHGRDAHTVLVEKSDGKRSLGWEDNIDTVLKEIRWDCVEWIYLAQDRTGDGLF